MKHSNSNSRAGFTMMEIAVVTGISALLLLGVGTIMTATLRTYRTLNNAINSNDQATRTLTGLVNELRTASVSANGSYPIDTAAANTVIFYADTDGDATIERVRYFMSGTTLSRGIIKPTVNPVSYPIGNEVITPVVQNITNSSSIFSYYDSNYNGVSAPLSFPVNLATVRLVKINLTIDSNPTESPNVFYLSAQAALRNLKDNL